MSVAKVGEGVVPFDGGVDKIVEVGIVLSTDETFLDIKLETVEEVKTMILIAKVKEEFVASVLEGVDGNCGRLTKILESAPSGFDAVDFSEVFEEAGPETWPGVEPVRTVGIIDEEVRADPVESVIRKE